jgi:hypothetical protein
MPDVDKMVTLMAKFSAFLAEGAIILDEFMAAKKEQAGMTTEQLFADTAADSDDMEAKLLADVEKYRALIPSPVLVPGQIMTDEDIAKSLQPRETDVPG